MKNLILNCGSSTLKFQIVETSESGAVERKLARVIIDRIGGPASYRFEADGAATVKHAWVARDHEAGVGLMLSPALSRRRVRASRMVSQLAEKKGHV